MEANFLRFILLDPQYRIRLLDSGTAGAIDRSARQQLMTCWQGYLFVLDRSDDSVAALRCSEEFARGEVRIAKEELLKMESVGGLKMRRVKAEGVKGLYIDKDRLVYYSDSTIFRISCADCIAGRLDRTETLEFGDGRICKADGHYLINHENKLYSFESGAISLLSYGVHDISGPLCLSEEGNVKTIEKNHELFRLPGGFKADSLHYLHGDLVAVGGYQSFEEPKLLLFVRDSNGQYDKVDLMNPTNAGHGEPLGRHSVCFFSGWEGMEDLLVISHSCSIQLALAGRVDSSAQFDQIALASDEYLAELPLTDDGDDTTALSVAVDVCNPSVFRIVSDESEYIEFPPSPVFFILCSDGRLVPFKIVNTRSKEPLSVMNPLIADLTGETAPVAAPTEPSMVELKDASSVQPEETKKKEIVSRPEEEVEEKTAQGFMFTPTLRSKPEPPSLPGFAASPSLSGLDIPIAKPIMTDPSNKPGILAPTRKTDTLTTIPRPETIDFSPKQNTLVQAFIDLHNAHSENIKKITKSIDQVSKAMQGLRECERMTGDITALEDKHGTAWKQQKAVYDLLAQVTSLKKRVEEMNADNGLPPFVTAISANKAELEESADKAIAFAELCQSLCSLDLSGDGKAKIERTRWLVGHEAVKKVSQCAELVERVLSTPRKTTVSSTSPKHSMNSGLKRILGRRKVGLLPIAIDKIEGPSGKKPREKAKIDIPSLLPIPKMEPSGGQRLLKDESGKAPTPPIPFTSFLENPIVTTDKPAVDKPSATDKTLESTKIVAPVESDTGFPHSVARTPLSSASTAKPEPIASSTKKESIPSLPFNFAPDRPFSFGQSTVESAKLPQSADAETLKTFALNIQKEKQPGVEPIRQETSFSFGLSKSERDMSGSKPSFSFSVPQLETTSTKAERPLVLPQQEQSQLGLASFGLGGDDTTTVNNKSTAFSLPAGIQPFSSTTTNVEGKKPFPLDIPQQPFRLSSSSTPSLLATSNDTQQSASNTPLNTPSKPGTLQGSMTFGQTATFAPIPGLSAPSSAAPSVFTNASAPSFGSLANTNQTDAKKSLPPSFTQFRG